MSVPSNYVVIHPSEIPLWESLGFKVPRPTTKWPPAPLKLNRKQRRARRPH